MGKTLLRRASQQGTHLAVVSGSTPGGRFLLGDLVAERLLALLDDGGFLGGNPRLLVARDAELLGLPQRIDAPQELPAAVADRPDDLARNVVLLGDVRDVLVPRFLPLHQQPEPDVAFIFDRVVPPAQQHVVRADPGGVVRRRFLVADGGAFHHYYVYCLLVPFLLLLLMVRERDTHTQELLLGLLAVLEVGR